MTLGGTHLRKLLLILLTIVLLLQVACMPKSSVDSSSVESDKSDASQITSETMKILTKSDSSLASFIEAEDSDNTYAYSLDFKLVNWANSGDTVYAITESPNQLWVFNAVSMETLAVIAMPDKPSEIHLDGYTVLISIPALKSIKKYDANT